MLGNDIVDICSDYNIKSFQRKRYIEFCFLPHEINLINISEWVIPFVLWSAKESAYKSFVKAGCFERFNPQKYSCTLSGADMGKNMILGVVEYNNQNVSFISDITERYVHTTSGKRTELENAVKYVAQLEPCDINNSEKLIRKYLCDHLKKEKKLMNHRLRIMNHAETGIPFLYIDERLCKMMDISLSHDDKFIAYCHSKFNTCLSDLQDVCLT